MEVILQTKLQRSELIIDLPYEPQIGDEIRVGDYTFWVSSTHYRFDSYDGKYYRVLDCIVETVETDCTEDFMEGAFCDFPELVSNYIKTSR